MAEETVIKTKKIMRENEQRKKAPLRIQWKKWQGGCVRIGTSPANKLKCQGCQCSGGNKVKIGLDLRGDTRKCRNPIKKKTGETG